MIGIRLSAFLIRWWSVILCGCSRIQLVSPPLGPVSWMIVPGGRFGQVPELVLMRMVELVTSSGFPYTIRSITV